MATTTEDSGDDPLTIVLRERLEALEARNAALADEAAGDDTKQLRLQMAREYITRCWELLDEDEGADD
jgi:hypothetical protein